MRPGAGVKSLDEISLLTAAPSRVNFREIARGGILSGTVPKAAYFHALSPRRRCHKSHIIQIESAICIDFRVHEKSDLQKNTAPECNSRCGLFQNISAIGCQCSSAISSANTVLLM